MTDNNKLAPEEAGLDNAMRNVDGRAFIWHLLQTSGVFESMFDNDPISHAFNAGEREMGLKLKSMVLDVAPEYFVIMIKENIG